MENDLCAVLLEEAQAHTVAAGRAADERWHDLAKEHAHIATLLTEAASKITLLQAEMQPKYRYGKVVLDLHGTLWVQRKELVAANNRANTFQDELEKLKNEQK